MTKSRTILAAAALAAAVMAQAPPPGPQPPQPPVTELKAYLSLTDTQVQGLLAVQTQKHAAVQQIVQEIQTKEKSLREKLTAGSTDALALGTLLVEIQNLRKRVQAADTQFRDQALAVLTADQKTKLKALEDASKLHAQIQQAAMLDLLTLPQPPAGAGPGGPGVPGGPGPRGPMGEGGGFGPGPGPGFGPGGMGFRLRR